MNPPEQLILAQRLAQQIFPAPRPLLVSKVAEGGSTWVYRIDHGVHTYYLRVLPEENASFAPELCVHAALLARNLHVPEVVYFDNCDEAFQRSVLVTSAIPGHPLSPSASPVESASILRAAGRELAELNRLSVDGFGWVRRDSPRTDEVRAEYPTFAAWMIAEMDQALPLLVQNRYISAQGVASLREVLGQVIGQAGNAPATLAHGDFDLTHIFCKVGEYTGMIDFGEIRGTHCFYDLGHFAIENHHLLPPLLDGYQEISALEPDYHAHIRQSALLIAVVRTGRRLARAAEPLTIDRKLIENESALNAGPSKVDR